MKSPNFLLLLASGLATVTSSAQPNFTTLHHFGESSLIGQLARPLARGSDGTMYGVTEFGGAGSGGVLYRLSADGSTRTILREFGSVTNGGTRPDRAVLPASNGFLYGFTKRGSTNSQSFEGIIYRVGTNGAGYTVLRHLPSFGDGWQLIEASNGRIYGLTGAGLIGFDADGGSFSTLFTNVFTETDSLFEGQDGMLYMVEGSDSIDVSDGALYRINKDGSNLVVLRSRIPFRGVVGNNTPAPCCAFQSTDGFIYGMEDVGGDSYFFRTDTNVATSAAGWVEQGSLNLLGFQHLPTTFFQASDGKFYGSFSRPYVFAPQGYLFRWDSFDTISTTRTNLVNWPTNLVGPFGGTPAKSFLEGSDGRFYGVVDGGGRHGAGWIFRVDKDGTGFTPLSEFFENDGSNASPPVILASDEFLYGTTREGGLQDLGTLYRVRPDGTDYNMIRQFLTRDEGADPAGGVIDGGDGFLYGATASGGSQNLGTIYKLRYDGSEFAVIYSIRSNRPAATPQDPSSITGSLVMDTNGWLYGVGATGGSAGRGGVFRARKDGTLFTNIHNFIVGEARRPVGGPVLAQDGRLWGTTENGGANDAGVLYRLNTDGSGFQILRAFGGTNDGANPSAPLWQAPGGIFFGATFGGGTSNVGTVFRYHPADSNYAVLHHFGGGTDGRRPSAGLVETSDGVLVGATRFGGSGAPGRQLGTLFKLNKDGSGYEVLRSFTGENGDGESVFSTLTKGSGDSFFGTTSLGGNRDFGTVFTFALGDTPAPPPSITSQPGSFVGGPGGAITLSIQATGPPPLSYQWFFRGAAIGGATNASLVLSNLAPSDAGSYTVRVTNASGSTNSAPACVTLFGINIDRSLTLHGEPGIAHRIDFMEVFAGPPQNWQPLTNVALPVGPITVVDPEPGGTSQRFYRAVKP